MTGVVGNGWHRLLRVCFLKFHPDLPAGARIIRPPGAWDDRAGAFIVWTPPTERGNTRFPALSQLPRMERNRSFQH
jgi:hypothetical protein